MQQLVAEVGVIGLLLSCREISSSMGCVCIHLHLHIRDSK